MSQRNKERYCNGWFEVKGQKYYFRGNIAAVSSSQAEYFCAGQIQRDFNTDQFIKIEKFNDMTLDSQHKYLRQQCNKFVYVTYEKMMETKKKTEEARKLAEEIYPSDEYEILLLTATSIKTKSKITGLEMYHSLVKGHIYEWLLKDKQIKEEWQKFLDEA